MVPSDFRAAIDHLRLALTSESISYGELAYIDQLADEYGVSVTGEMMASDVLDELETLA